MSRDPLPGDYSVLGLRPGATATEVRDAYRRLVKEFHPDRNPGDALARRRFQQVTESYAALRSVGRTAAGAMPPRPGPPRGDSGAPAETIDTLPIGAALWVHPEDVLVAPDRSARLSPDGTGSAYPDAENTVRVDRRGDGFHVFMPPQPSVRWPITADADAVGLAIAALWAGDRQEDHGAPSPRMPRRLLGRTIAEMECDTTGWASTAALHLDGSGRWLLDGAEPLASEPHPSIPLRVLRDETGYWVHSDLGTDHWPAVEVPDGLAAIPVDGGQLAGVSIEPAPAEPTV
ncbi:MAG: J domain-containing protein [Candidatus Dormibacteraeota bacterium]|nr:J domain-containing protein [Candidatus Dormibacteraeota bacterium]